MPRRRTSRVCFMPHPPAVSHLPDEWRTLAAQQRSLGADAQARTLEFCADRLQLAVRHAADELLSLRRAAEESGYSADHLGRLLRDGAIPNAGRRSRPLIRRGDLPAKGRKRREEPCRADAGGYVADRLVRDIIHSKFGG